MLQKYQIQPDGYIESAYATLRHFSRVTQFRGLAANPHGYKRLSSQIGTMPVNEALRAVIANRGEQCETGDLQLYSGATYFEGERGSRWLNATAFDVVQSDPLQTRPVEIELEFGRINCLGLPRKTIVILGLYGLNYDRADEFFAGTVTRHSSSGANQRPEAQTASQIRITQLVAQATDLLLRLPEGPDPNARLNDHKPAVLQF